MRRNRGTNIALAVAYASDCQDAAELETFSAELEKRYRADFIDDGTEDALRRAIARLSLRVNRYRIDAVERRCLQAEAA